MHNAYFKSYLMASASATAAVKLVAVGNAVPREPFLPDLLVNERVAVVVVDWSGCRRRVRDVSDCVVAVHHRQRAGTIALDAPVRLVEADVVLPLLAPASSSGCVKYIVCRTSNACERTFVFILSSALGSMFFCLLFTCSNIIVSFN